MKEIIAKVLGLVEGLLSGAATKQALGEAGASPTALAGAATVRVTLPTLHTVPKRPPFTVAPSPNFRSAPGRRITCVVMHATATTGLASPLGWLCNPASKVSAHYLISATGQVYRLVHEADVAWHAGVSSWRGRSDVNAFSVGIELVNDNQGSPYPEAQVAAAAQLTRAICSEHGIAVADVVRHADIAPGRKNDPAGFDMAAFRARIA